MFSRCSFLSIQMCLTGCDIAKKFIPCTSMYSNGLGGYSEGIWFESHYLFTIHNPLPISFDAV